MIFIKINMLISFDTCPIIISCCLCLFSWQFKNRRTTNWRVFSFLISGFLQAITPARRMKLASKSNLLVCVVWLYRTFVCFYVPELMLLKCIAASKSSSSSNGEPVYFRWFVASDVIFYFIFRVANTNQLRIIPNGSNKKNNHANQTSGSRINRFIAGFFENYSNIKWIWTEWVFDLLAQSDNDIFQIECDHWNETHAHSNPSFIIWFWAVSIKAKQSKAYTRAIHSSNQDVCAPNMCEKKSIRETTKSKLSPLHTFLRCHQLSEIDKK